MTLLEELTAIPEGPEKRAAVPMPFTEPDDTPVVKPPAIVITVAFGKIFRTLLFDWSAT